MMEHVRYVHNLVSVVKVILIVLYARMATIWRIIMEHRQEYVENVQ